MPESRDFHIKSIGVPVRVQFLVSMNETTRETNQYNKKPNAKDRDAISLVVFLSQRHEKGRLNKGAMQFVGIPMDMKSMENP